MIILIKSEVSLVRASEKTRKEITYAYTETHLKLCYVRIFVLTKAGMLGS
jgi:hypothetical protein